MNFLRKLAGGLALSMAVLGAAGAQTGAAQSFPSKPIRIVVPFGAGTTDQAARFLAQRITQATGQPVIVENKPGANGFIGVQYAAQQPADGYTVMIGTNTTQAANLSLFKKLPYDPQKDFTPVTALIVGGVVLVVSADSPIKSVRDLVAAAKQQPGKLTFGSANSSSRGGGEVFKSMAGVDILHVPYKTLPAAVTDVIGGQITMTFGDAPAVMPLVRSGKLRALGISTRSRIPGLEDIPTIASEGVPGYEVAGWLGVFAPAGTPQAIVQRLNEIIVPIMRSPEAQEFFGRNAWQPIAGKPEELAQFVSAEIDRWAKLVKAAGIEPE